MSEQEWRQYICRACGIIYDESLGDPDSGIAPGTRFEDIPDDWVCPVCGVGKADFELYQRREIVAAAAAPALPPAREAGVVIVGAGIAGWSVAEALRAADATIPITLVTTCPGDVYHKPELSVALSRGLTPERLCRESGEMVAARLSVRLLAQTCAVGLSPEQHQLRTTQGTLRYRHLVLAMGSKPALPPALPPQLVWRVNDLRGWRGFHERLAGGRKRIAIVGAGMVGCELAEDAARAGHDVVLLDLKLRPLADLVPEPAAKRIEAGLAGLGVRFHGGAEITEVAEIGARKRLTLRSGEQFEVDVVVAATGLVTEARMARAAGLAFDRGIVVEPRTMRTSAAGVYALGDCVSIEGRPCRFIEPIAFQAQAIAAAILGRPAEGGHRGHPTIRLKLRSAPLVIHGVPVAGGEWRTVSDQPSELAMEQWRDGRLAAELRVA